MGISRSVTPAIVGSGSGSSIGMGPMHSADLVSPTVSANFNYHHEFSNSGGNLTRDHTGVFRKSLIHKWNNKHSILCMVASPKRKLLFCGTQNSSIIVLDLVTFQLKLEIETHVGSVLCLHLSDCEDILFSGGSDSLVKIWEIHDTVTPTEKQIQLVPTHTIYSLLDVGDIFSITWIKETKSVFIGSQNASLSYVHINTDIDAEVKDDEHLQYMPSNRFDKFFDSNSNSNTPRASTPLLSSASAPVSMASSTPKLVQISSDNIISYAHNGYLYALDSITIDNPLTSTIGNNIANTYRHVVVSAGGDGEIKLWGHNRGTLDFLMSLHDDSIDSVFSLTIHRPSLVVYAGSTNGNVCIWDLTTFQLLKIIQIDNNDVFSLALSPPPHYSSANTDSTSTTTSASTTGANTTAENAAQWLLMGTELGITKKRISDSALYVEEPQSAMEVVRVTKDDPCLTLRTFQIGSESYLVSAGSDKTISLWSLESMTDTCRSNSNNNSSKGDGNVVSSSGSPLSCAVKNTAQTSTERFLQVLAELIEFRSVSKQPDIYMGECRRCANYLTILFKYFGATTSQLLPVDNGNPVVHAVFKANSQSVKNGEREPTRIVWYGHYDVIPASAKNWNTPPFTMTPQDGYLYARGVTDNKGPLLVAIFAIADLHSKGELESDVIFLVEGEEESGSWGFQNAVLQNLHEISNGGKSIDWIMLSNSYWLDDNVPSLNYGLRGKLEIELSVWSDNPDRHSGVDGGVYIEPSMDLVKLLGKLVDHDRVTIPGFEEIYDKSNTDNEDDFARYLEPWEVPLYKEIHERVPGLNINELIRKWRLPSLTLHKVDMSGTDDNSTVISQRAIAKLSIRIIPGQELHVVKESFIDYIQQSFAELGSTNHVDIQIMHEAEPWLGDVNNVGYKTLKSCISEEWGIDPILVREGGSIPSIRFLEKAFGCSAVHVPTGQASDNAHLNNERVRILNLLKSREIIKKAANRLPKHD